MADDRLSILIETIDRASSGLKRIGAALGGVAGAYLSFRTAQAVFRQTFDTLQRGVNLSLDYEANAFKLNTALANQGAAFEGALDDLLKFADALQKTTQFTDDQIVPAMVSLANISGKTGDELKDLTRLTLDAAVTFNKDLLDASVLVGKSAVGVTDRMNELGLAIDKSITGKAARGAAALALLRSRTNDMAQSVGQTFRGSLQVLSSVYDTFLRNLGDGVKESAGARKAVQDLIKMFNKLAETVDSKALAQGINEIVLALSNLTVVLADMTKIIDKPDELFKEFASTLLAGFIPALRTSGLTIEEQGRLIAQAMDNAGAGINEFNRKYKATIDLTSKSAAFAGLAKDGRENAKALTLQKGALTDFILFFADTGNETASTARKMRNDIEQALDFDITGLTGGDLSFLETLREQVRKLNESARQTARSQRELDALTAAIERTREKAESPFVLDPAPLLDDIERMEKRVKELQKELGFIQPKAQQAAAAVKELAAPVVPVIDLTSFAEGIKAMDKQAEFLKGIFDAAADGAFPVEALNRLDLATALFKSIGQEALAATDEIIAFEAASGRVLTRNKKTGTIEFDESGVNAFQNSFEAAVQFSSDLEGNITQINSATGETLVLNDAWLASVGKEGLLAAYDKVLESTNGTVEGTEAVIDALDRATLKAEIQADVMQAVAGTVADLGGALVDAFTDADASFSEFAKNALKQLAKMIVQAAIFRAIMSAFGGGGGGNPVAGLIPIAGGGFAHLSTPALDRFLPGVGAAPLPSGPELAGGGAALTVGVNALGTSDAFVRTLMKKMTEAGRQHGVQLEIVSG